MEGGLGFISLFPLVSCSQTVLSPTNAVVSMISIYEMNRITWNNVILFHLFPKTLGKIPLYVKLKIRRILVGMLFHEDIPNSLQQECACMWVRVSKRASVSVWLYKTYVTITIGFVVNKFKCYLYIYIILKNIKVTKKSVNWINLWRFIIPIFHIMFLNFIFCIYTLTRHCLPLAVLLQLWLTRQQMHGMCNFLHFFEGYYPAQKTITELTLVIIFITKQKMADQEVVFVWHYIVCFAQYPNANSKKMKSSLYIVT